MLALLVALTLSAPPSERALMDLVRHQNQGCLQNPRCQAERGRYFATKALRPIVRALRREARRIRVSPLFLAAWIQSESEWVSDAVSQHNKVKPHPTDPWGRPPLGRRSWKGLDLGLGQLHCPSFWSSGCWKPDVARMRDPVANVRTLAEWVRRSRDRCRVHSTARCQQMYELTGVAVSRRPSRLPRLLQEAKDFLHHRKERRDRTF